MAQMIMLLLSKVIGTNIAVTNTGKDIKVELKKDLTVDSVKAGDFFMDKKQRRRLR